ncbi:DUF262 domain-containing protein [Rummeliibacillus stabekisii]|uniref:DUF262 domain-containing protein n=1 Tax=Rummeliibacillus stabekisii TaxID=241244 RepID=UPI00203DED49|nr:DUF262 domain-containing protein [Rummeliibacillus stabekisii]
MLKGLYQARKDVKKMSESKPDLLLSELKNERQNIKTDSYSMSIGEIVNLYEDGDLNLAPAFQRLFRWNDQQKTKFIESILIGIPIPEIFVSQKSDGKWDVVDGVQRLSTVLQLMGKLPSFEPLKLTESMHLPSMEGYTWDDLPNDLRRILRRGKMGVNIILTENSVQAQYELFQRLNTGGLHLSAQEIRNCLLIMVDEEFFAKIDKIKCNKDFLNIININQEKIEEEYHMELLVRYLISKINIVDYSKYNLSKAILDDFIDAEIVNILEKDIDIDIDTELKLFEDTVKFLNKNLGNKTFKKYNVDKGQFEGQLSIGSFEAIFAGVAENLEKLKQLSQEQFSVLVKEMYSHETYMKYSGRGTRALNRFKNLTEFSKEYYKI